MISAHYRSRADAANRGEDGCVERLDVHQTGEPADADLDEPASAHARKGAGPRTPEAPDRLARLLHCFPPQRHVSMAGAPRQSDRPLETSNDTDEASIGDPSDARSVV
jgi:hypothetical protein